MSKWSSVLRLSLAVVLLVAIAALSSGASAGRSLPTELTVRPTIPSYLDDPLIIVKGQHVFLNGYLSYSTIMIIDASNPIALRQLGTIVIPPEPSQEWISFDVVGDRLYAYELRRANWESWEGVVHIYDISEPESPIELTQVGPLPGFPSAVRVSEDNKFMHITNSGIFGIAIFDISDLSHVRQVTTYAGASIIESLTVRYSYIRSYYGDDSFLEIYDISDINKPVLVSDRVLQNMTIGMEDFDIENGYLYTESTKGTPIEVICQIQIIDISDPLQPIKLKQFDLNDCWSANNISVDNEQLFIHIHRGNGPLWEEVRVYDISNSSEVAVSTSYQWLYNHAFTHFDVSDTCIYGGGGERVDVLCLTTLIGVTPTPTVAPMPTATATLLPTATPTPSSTARPTLTPTPSATPTLTPTAAPQRLYLPRLVSD